MTSAETPLADGLILAWPESYTPWSTTRLNNIGNEFKEMSDFELYVSNDILTPCPRDMGVETRIIPDECSLSPSSPKGCRNNLIYQFKP